MPFLRFENWTRTWKRARIIVHVRSCTDACACSRTYTRVPSGIIRVYWLDRTNEENKVIYTTPSLLVGRQANKPTVRPTERPTDRQTDRPTDKAIWRVASSRIKVVVAFYLLREVSSPRHFLIIPFPSFPCTLFWMILLYYLLKNTGPPYVKVHSLNKTVECHDDIVIAHTTSICHSVLSKPYSRGHAP